METTSTVTRRDLVKQGALGVAGAAALGIFGEMPATGYAAEQEAPAAVKEVVSFNGVVNPAPMTGDGRYVTKTMGHEDYIYVATTLREGAITECRVLSHKETIGIGSFACARIPAAIVEHQSVNVPNLRGCSITSMAIKRAVEEAIEQAGYDLADFSAEVAEPNVDAHETLDVDAVVVGAGNAGLVCAAKLADEGLNVLVLEKHAIPGGSWGMTYSGIWAAGTRAINGYNVDGSVPPNYASIDGLIESLARYNQDDCVDRYDGANPFAKQSYPAATRAVDWMTDCGVGFMPLGMYEGAFSAGFTSYFAPGIYMGGAGYALMAMAQRLEKLPNSEIKYLVKATELIQDETGRVTGIKAQGLKSDDSPNGYELTVNAKAVVLATGSYALNRELLEEYEPRFADQTYHCCSASTGDGHLMALKAGSKMECTGIQFPAYPATTSFFEIAFIDVHSPIVTVNGNGGFIGRTGTSHADLSMALLDENNGGRFFCVLDASAEPTLRYLPSMGYDTYKALYNRGELLYYQTAEDAAADLDLPELPEFLAENNRAALANEPDRYGRTCRYMELGSGIFVIPMLPLHYLTPSGICIDPEQRVLTDEYLMDGDNTVIEGLYAVGDVPGTISTREGRGYLNGHPLAIASGYLAAETIQKDLA